MTSGNGGWLAAGDRYELSLSGSRVVARRAGGAPLKSVPATLKDHPINEQLKQLREFLDAHDHECASTVETWMIRSLPVAAALIAAVWPDPAWSKALRNSVIWPIDCRNQAEPRSAGFLSAATPERGLGIVTLDGETTWLQDQAIGIPHPVLVPELEDFREFATELGLEQNLHQLHRETWSLPKTDGNRTSVDAFAGGRFPQLIQALNRARAFGYSISGGHAVCRLWDPSRGLLVEARYWVGSDAPTSGAMTGTLEWVGRGGQTLPLRDLGPVAYSEGMRMAARIYAGRAPDQSPE